MRINITTFLLFIPLLSLAACGTIPEIPTSSNGTVIGIEAGGYELDLRKTPDVTDITVTDTDEPAAHLRIQVVTKDLERFTGVLASGDTVVLPPGSVTLTVSVASPTDPVTGSLAPVAPPPPGGSQMVQGPSGPPQVYQPHRITLISVDQLTPTDAWDTYGDFTLLTRDNDAAHILIHKWAQARGQDAALNSQIAEIHSAWTTELVTGRLPGLAVRALNEQESVVGGTFAYEDGSGAQLMWATSAPGPSGLWEAGTVVAASLFPDDGYGFLGGSFEVRLRSANRHDGLQSLSIGIELNDVPVP